jgi:hypothetical protein
MAGLLERKQSPRSREVKFTDTSLLEKVAQGRNHACFARGCGSDNRNDSCWSRPHDGRGLFKVEPFRFGECYFRRRIWSLSIVGNGHNVRVRRGPGYMGAFVEGMAFDTFAGLGNAAVRV